jgi:hypothetical protein
MTDPKATEVTQADRDAANHAFDIAFQGNTDTIDDDMAELFARHRIAAEEAGARKALDAAAKIADKRAVDRFDEYGTTEPDTNASYYSGRRSESLDELDEEDWAIRDAIHALDPALIVRGKNNA